MFQKSELPFSIPAVHTRLRVNGAGEAGFPKSRVLFNLHRAAATGEPAVIVVEGFFDGMKVHQAGFPAVAALMGAALYERQRELLCRRFRQVMLMLDDDDTGRRASAAIAGRLRSICPVQAIELASNIQSDQFPVEVIEHLLALVKGSERRDETDS